MGPDSGKAELHPQETLESGNAWRIIFRIQAESTVSPWEREGLIVKDKAKGWVNGTFKTCVLSKKAYAIGLCRRKPHHKNSACGFLLQ